MLPAVTSASGRLIDGRYRLREPLGQGGMGVVWLAHDELLDRTVAVKEVYTSGGVADEIRERMLREARAAARLDHPGAVRVYDVVEEDDGRPWIVMEVLTGHTLKDAVNEDGPLPAPRVAEIGLALVDAISAAHRADILHRDIKPANVQLCDDGRVVLTDFGIASIAGDSSITRTGDILGSPAYMSPERARGQQLGPEADLFALGATLYAAVEGEPPFERDTPVATLTAIVNDPPRPCRRAGPLAPIIAGLLEKDPTRRLTADAAREQLAAISHGDDPESTAAWSAAPVSDETRAMPAVIAPPPVSSTPPVLTGNTQVPTKRRSLGMWLLVVLLVAVAGGVGAAYALRGHNDGNGGGTSSSDDGPFSPGEGGIPSDWKTHRGDGWLIATPADWDPQESGSTLRFRRPASEPYGYVAVVPGSGSDANAVLDDFGRQFKASHTTYEQVSRETRSFRGSDTSVLTVTYEDSGTDLEASFMPFIADGHTYLLWWQAKPDGWDASLSLRDQVLSTFRAPT